MKKQLSILLFLVGSVFVVLSFLTNSFTVENNTSLDITADPVNELNGNMYSYGKLHTTGGSPWTAISKTITKDYASVADVPAAVYYTEYIDGKWYSGTPKLTGEVQKLSHAWRATYTGEINY